MFKEFNKLIKR